MDNFKFQDKSFSFSRYPKTDNRSLRAWSAADEYLINSATELVQNPENTNTAIYNDRFGFLGCLLHHHHPSVIVERKSQLTAIHKNLEANGLKKGELKFKKLLEETPASVDTALIHIPKSMDLFELYLQRIHQNLSDTGTVLAGFMTKYFTPQMLEISNRYFEEVEQSLARKKARILQLSGKKEVSYKTPIHEIQADITGNGEELIKQYYGVFSSDHIDYATQFLIDNLKVEKSDKAVLDLACGNGVIAKAVRSQNPEAELHLTDDSWLAIRSAQLNLKGENTHFYWSDTLADIVADSMDLVVSNPPFHFGHETNIEVSVWLFKEVARVLKPDGRFICVANQHLNYRTHLQKLFKGKNPAQNKKYVLYECTL